MNKQFIDQYINQTNEQVEGWFYQLDMILIYMLDAAQKSNNIGGGLCEIGVFQGKSLILLAALAEAGEPVLALDMFPGDLLEKARNNVRKFLPDMPEPVFVKDDTSNYTEANTKTLITTPLRMLHIDAGHEYHEVLHSMYLFVPHLLDHGVLIMDDYQDPEFPGIDAAVLDFCQETSPRRLVPFLSGGNKLYLATQAVAKQYQDFLARQEMFKDCMRLCRVRDFDILIAKSKLPMKTDIILQHLKASREYQGYSADISSLTQSAREFSRRTIASGRNINT